MSPDDWQALGTCVAAVVAVVATIFAFVQVRQARKVRIEQAMPHVVAFMDPSLGLAEFVVRNFGPTAALDVRIGAEPRLRRTTPNGKGAEDVWLPDVIPVLAPGQEWRVFWDAPTERLSNDSLKDELRHEVTVSYTGDVLNGREVQYRAVLDWGAYIGMRYVGRKTIHDAARSLEVIAKTLGKWSDYGAGLSVFVRDGAQKDAQAAERSNERARLWAERQEARNRQTRERPEPEGPGPDGHP